MYFLHHRELLGALSLAAYQTMKEPMAAAVEEKGLRPWVVAVVRTFGARADFNPRARRLALSTPYSRVKRFGVPRGVSVATRFQA